MMGNSIKDKSKEKGIIIKTLHTQLYPYMQEFLGYNKLYDYLGCGLSVGKIVENTCNLDSWVNGMVVFWGDFHEYQFIKENDVSLTTLLHISSENIIPFLFYDYFVIAFNVLEICQYHDAYCLSIGSEGLLEKVIGYVLKDNDINVSYVKEVEEYALIMAEENGIGVRDNATGEVFSIECETGKCIFDNTYRNEISDILKNLDPSDWITAHVHSENLQFYLKTYDKAKLKQKALVMDW